jgi:hypothetical protein
MRMIVEAFAETLELGLAKPNQIVVRTTLYPVLSPSFRIRFVALFSGSPWMEMELSLIWRFGQPAIKDLIN